MPNDDFGAELTALAYRMRREWNLCGDDVERIMVTIADGLAIGFEDYALDAAADLGVLPLEEFAPPASG